MSLIRSVAPTAAAGLVIVGIYTGCVIKIVSEGSAPGDCLDGADNDADGLWDCDDPGCWGSPDCTGNTAPTAPGVSIDPLEPTDEDVLNCVIDTASEDVDGDAITYSYQWTKDGVDTGSTAPTVSAADTTNEEVWSCTVTPNDGVTDGATGSASVTIGSGNAVPSAPSVYISPSEPTTDDLLNCLIDTESVDDDGDTVSYSYDWLLEGVDAGISGATVAATETTFEEEWTCVVTPNDGMDDGDPGEASVTIARDECWSLDFDGTDDAVQIGDGPELLGITNAFTVSAWIKIDPASSGSMRIWDAEQVGSATSSGSELAGLWFGLEANQLFAGFGTGVHPWSRTLIAGSTTLTDSTWIHVAVTRSGGDGTLYVDGVMDASTSALPAVDVNWMSSDGTEEHNRYTIGQRVYDSRADGHFFYGKMAGVGVWNRALSSTEVASLVSDGLTSSTMGSCAGYWPFNEGTGGGVIDMSGVGHLGTVDGATWSADCP